MAGVAAWRADEAARPGILARVTGTGAQSRYREVVPPRRKRTNSRPERRKLYGVRVVLRYDADTVPVETARGMVKAVDTTFARVSEQLGCYAEEKS